MLNIKGRLIFFDVENTGGPKNSIVEIGAVEMMNGELTGKAFHSYLRPPEKVHWHARKIHGLSDKFLSDKPDFSEVCSDLMEFIADSPVLAHGAHQDRKSLLREMSRAGKSHQINFYCTLPFAAMNNKKSGIDALMARYMPEHVSRGEHSALADALILATVFSCMSKEHPEDLTTFSGKATEISAQISKNKRNWGDLSSEERERLEKHLAAIQQKKSDRLTGLISHANESMSASEAADIPNPHDKLMRTRPEVLRSMAGSEACKQLDAAFGSEKEDRRSHADALRMIVRGMSPDLAIRREHLLAERRRALAEQESAILHDF